MEKYCKTCGKKYYVKPKDFDHSSYCSRKCMADDYKKILIGDKNPNYRNASIKICLNCGKEFERYNKSSKYCSQECYHSSEETKMRLANITSKEYHCKVCGIVVPRRRKLCDEHAPKPKKKYYCKDCGAEVSKPDVKNCKNCRYPGKNRKTYFSICQKCGATVVGYKRKYCNTCWSDEMLAKREHPRRIDENQPEIIDALEANGCGVIDLSAQGGGVPDLLVYSKNTGWILMEVKNPKYRSVLNKKQREWIAAWDAPVYVVRTPEEALEVVIYK